MDDKKPQVIRQTRSGFNGDDKKDMKRRNKSLLQFKQINDWLMIHFGLFSLILPFDFYFDVNGITMF